MFDQPLLLDMIFLGTPSYVVGCTFYFFSKCPLRNTLMCIYAQMHVCKGMPVARINADDLLTLVTSVFCPSLMSTNIMKNLNDFEIIASVATFSMPFILSGWH